MSWSDGTPYIEKLAAGIYAYIQPDGSWMINNCGVIADPSGRSVLVDTTSTERRNRAMLAEVARVAPGTPSTLVNTHHHPDHTYGNGFLPARRASSVTTSAGRRCSGPGSRRPRSVADPDYGNLSAASGLTSSSTRMTLHLAEFPVELWHVGPAHTRDDVAGLAARAAGAVRRRPGLRGRAAPSCSKAPWPASASALQRMRELEPEVSLPATGRCAAGKEVARLLDEHGRVRRPRRRGGDRVYAAGLTPLEARSKHRTTTVSPTGGRASASVGNLHRAYPS